MHFLEAHRIVHEFAGAVGKMNEKSMLIPYSWIQHSEQEIVDAFIIFFGHMVFWHTRTNEEYEKYNTLLMWINNVISDDLYDLIIDAKNTIDKLKQSFLYKTLNKSKIASADKTIRAETDLVLKGYEAYQKRIEHLDFGELVGEFQDYVTAYRNEPQESRKEFKYFWNDYIVYVYSKTSFNIPNDDDFTCFFTFDTMRKKLDNLDNLPPLDQKIYTEYKKYIMYSN